MILPAIKGAQRHTFDTDADWLAWRRTVITGSDTAAIVKGADDQRLSKYRDEWDVWTDKTQPPEPAEDNDRFRRGRYLEDGVLAYVRAEQTADGERLVVPSGKQVYQRGIFGGTPDAVTLNSGGHIIRGEECKRVSYSATDDWTGDDGKPRLPVWVQLQSRLYMHVLGVNEWRIHAYIMPDTFVTFPLTRDERIERHIVETSTDWWEHHVEQGHAPDISDADACTRYLRAAYPDRKYEARQATPGEMRAIETYRVAREMEKAAKANKKQAANEIRQAIADADGLTWDGRTVASITKRGSISVK